MSSLQLASFLNQMWAKFPSNKLIALSAYLNSASFIIDNTVVSDFIFRKNVFTGYQLNSASFFFIMTNFSKEESVKFILQKIFI